jgi:hypothetical protein
MTIEAGGKVFRRVHGAVDRAVDQRLIQLLGEKALAARFAQRAVLDRVAGGAHRFDGKMVFVDSVGSREEGARLTRLREREWASARADAKIWDGHGGSALRVDRARL